MANQFVEGGMGAQRTSTTKHTNFYRVLELGVNQWRKTAASEVTHQFQCGRRMESSRDVAATHLVFIM